jgi:hypothetical protein
MQVVGSSLVLPAVKLVAGRADRDPVREWAERVIFRHIKRTQSLMARVDTLDKLEHVLAREKLPPDAVGRIREALAAGEEFFAPSQTLVSRFLSSAADTMDYVCSLPDEDRRIKRIDRMSWTDAEALSAAWHAAIAKNGKKSRDLIAGTRRIMEFEDGSFGADLITAEALAAEGNAMGHCVGGYWARVLSGQTRIISIRDRFGNPHVTIELARSPRITLDDGTVVSVERFPNPGRDVVPEVGGEWVAVQVRGKQNKAPVEKWQGLVDQYFEANRITYSEFGRRLGGRGTGRSFVTYRVGNVVGQDPDVVAAKAEAPFAAHIEKNPVEFGKVYKASGLEAVHGHCADAERLGKQAEIYLPLSMSAVGTMVASGTPFRTAVGRSAVTSVLKLFSTDAEKAVSARRRILDLAIQTDAQESRVSSAPIVAMPGQPPLMHFRHELPLMTVSLLAMDALTGMEDEVAELVKPSLAAAASYMRKCPSAVHTVAAAGGGLEGADIFKAYLFCGLAAEYGMAVAAVEAGVKAKVKEMRLVAKRERVKPGANLPALNLVSNILADGYEIRIKDLSRKSGQGGLIVSPSVPEPVVFRQSADPEPVIKKYRLPCR